MFSVVSVFCRACFGEAWMPRYRLGYRRPRVLWHQCPLRGDVESLVREVVLLEHELVEAR
jgi:hypothetical protein